MFYSLAPTHSPMQCDINRFISAINNSPICARANFSMADNGKLPTVVNVSVRTLRKRGYASLVDWQNDPRHLYIGRFVHHVKGAINSLLANQYSVKKYGRTTALAMYEQHCRATPLIMQLIASINQYTELGCWCKPEACHGDIILKLYRERCITKPEVD
jgi:hypothetical protein